MAGDRNLAGDREAGSVIVHFGMHKTATSSIQESLFRRLADPRYFYVNLGSANASGALAAAFRDAPSRFHVHQKKATPGIRVRALGEKAVSRLNAELRSARGRTAILSGEDLSNFKASELRNLCDLIGGHGKVAIAAGYVRPPKAKMESAFQQRVKGGLQKFSMGGLYPEYRRQLEKFDSVLGRERVRLWLFDPQRFPGGCAVQDFCARLGIAFRPADVIRVNEGLSLPALSLLFAYRKFGPGYGVGPAVIRENVLLIQRLRNLPGAKLRLHSSLVAPVIERHRKDLDWIEARLGESLAEDLAADDAHAVRSEDDLLKFAPEALRWLAEQLGPEFAKRWHPGMDPRQVAEWMHLLRIRLASADERLQKAGYRPSGASSVSAKGPGEGDKSISLHALIQHARRSEPELETLPNEDARRLLFEAFEQIRRQIDRTREGSVKVDLLGHFRVVPGERAKDGRKVAVKWVSFHSAR